jgi:hypothetical protein
MVDYAPDDLYDQTPFDVDVLRRMPGFNRTDYWLAKLRRPLRWKREEEELSISHLLLAHRWVGQEIQPGVRGIAVEIAFVTDTSLVEDGAFDHSKAAHVAIGLVEDVTEEA